MKKFFVLMLSVAFLMAFAVGPVCAVKPGGVRAVFEADIVPESGSGVFGEVYIRDNALGDFKVELKDPAAADKEFSVTLSCNGTDYPLGSFTTDGNGEGKLVSTLYDEGIVTVVCTQATIKIEEVNGGLGSLIYYSGFYNTAG